MFLLVLFFAPKKRTIPFASFRKEENYLIKLAIDAIIVANDAKLVPSEIYCIRFEVSRFAFCGTITSQPGSIFPLPTFYTLPF